MQRGECLTEQDIQYALGQHLFLKNICIPNVMMRDSGKPPYEADFVYFNLNTLHIYEFGGFVKKSKRIKGSVKLNEQEKEYYMRIGCMKWVNR